MADKWHESVVIRNEWNVSCESNLAGDYNLTLIWWDLEPFHIHCCEIHTNLPETVKIFLVAAIEQQPFETKKSATQPATFITAQNTTYGKAEYNPFWKDNKIYYAHYTKSQLSPCEIHRSWDHGWLVDKLEFSQQEKRTKYFGTAKTDSLLISLS